MWIVRHGESTWNARGLAQGQATGPVLTRRGRHQARAVARLLSAAPISAVVTSDLARALETAEPIARALRLPIRIDPRLRERALGEAEGQLEARLTDTGVRNGRVVDAHAAPPAGESIAQLYGRVAACMAELVEETEPLLVTHGGVVRVLLAWTKGKGPDGMPWPPVANGRVVWRAVPPREVRSGTGHEAGAAR